MRMLLIALASSAALAVAPTAFADEPVHPQTPVTEASGPQTTQPAGLEPAGAAGQDALSISGNLTTIITASTTTLFAGVLGFVAASDGDDNNSSETTTTTSTTTTSTTTTN